MKDNKTTQPKLNTVLLNKIKKHMFYGLRRYKKVFCEFDFWQLLQFFNYKDHINIFLEQIQQSLYFSQEIIIYIHLPFCFSRCIFCDVKTFKINKFSQFLYIQYLKREIELISKFGLFKNKKVTCIHIGGGTPTCMKQKDLNNLIIEIKKFFNLEENCNITCEAHPLHLIKEEGKKRIKALKEIGINRISFGVQTFDKQVLKYCNRYHKLRDIEEAAFNLKNAGINYNLDMMIGLPGQTIEGVKRDLLELEKIKPTSIEYMRHSVVNELVIDLYKNHPELLTCDDDLFEMNLLVHQWIDKNKYEQSGYFLPNSKFCPYRYAWVMETPYLALGCGVRSHFGTITFCNYQDINFYYSRIARGILPIEKFHVLNQTERVLRSLFLRLQTISGISLLELNKRFGANCLTIINPILLELKKYKLISENKEIIKLTSPYGKYFLEDICNFIKEESAKILIRKKEENKVI